MNYIDIPEIIIEIIFYCFLAIIFGLLLVMLLLEIINTSKKNRTKKQGNKISVRIEREDDNNRLLIYEDAKLGYRHRTIRLKQHQYELLKYYFAENLPHGLLLEIIELSREDNKKSETEIAEKAYERYRHLYNDTDCM